MPPSKRSAAAPWRYDPRPPRGDRRRRPNARRSPGPGGRAAPCALPVAPVDPVYPCDDCRARSGTPRDGEMRHHAGRVESHRRPSGSLARPPVRRGDAVRLAAVTRPAHDRARTAAGRAALGPGRRHAQPRRRADDPAGRRARPRGPRHLRALVRARRPGTACSKTRASRSRMSPNGSATPRRRRSSSTRASISASPPAKCACR